MKKSLLALAVLGAFAGAASAQSSVTLFGIVDVNAGYVKNETGAGVSTKIKRLGTDGINSSRLGFRGVEDLGGGLKAGFHLEAALGPDVGSAGGGNGTATTTSVAAPGTGTVTNSNTAFFNRRSTVSLLGSFGEVRLGRDYDPSFWNLTVFDPFGTNGVGSFLNVVTTLSSRAGTLVRANNSVGYFLPSGIGGIYGQAMVAAGEGQGNSGNSADQFNKYAGGRIGYAAGPLDVAAGYGQTTVAPSSTGSDKFKLFNIGGAYDLGMVKLMAQYVDAKYDPLKAKTYLLGAVVPLGQGEVHAAYDHTKVTGGVTEPTAKQYALGYVYNLSKRTALYGTYSRVTNSGGAAFNVGSQGVGSAADGKSQGAEAGLRHSF